MANPQQYRKVSVSLDEDTIARLDEYPEGRSAAIRHLVGNDRTDKRLVAIEGAVQTLERQVEALKVRESVKDLREPASLADEFVGAFRLLSHGDDVKDLRGMAAKLDYGLFGGDAVELAGFINIKIGQEFMIEAHERTGTYSGTWSGAEANAIAGRVFRRYFVA